MKSIIIFSIVLLCSLKIWAQDKPIRRQSFNRFSGMDSVSMLLIPISWDNDGKFGDMKVIGEDRTKNILFYDPETDYKRFLFDGELQIIKKYQGPILRYRSPYDTTKRSLNRFHLYYTVVNDDYNQDGRLDSDDPVYLYYSNFDGTDLTLLTPKGFSLRNFEYIERSNVIMATLVKDANEDKEFDSNDVEVLYKVNFNDLSQSKVITELRLKRKDGEE